jgi:hypothetical protein
MHNLYRYIDWLMNLPKEIDRRLHQEVISHLQEKTTMEYISGLERIFLERGKANAEFRSASKLLLQKFGVAGTEYANELQARNEPEKYTAVIEHILLVNTLEELKQLVENYIPETSE